LRITSLFILTLCPTSSMMVRSFGTGEEDWGPGAVPACVCVRDNLFECLLHRWELVS
jgi:hypothetical protein